MTDIIVKHGLELRKGVLVFSRRVYQEINASRQCSASKNHRRNVVTCQLWSNDTKMRS